MKTFWSLFAKLLLIVVIVEAWFLYDYYHKNQQLVAENIQLEEELLQSKEALFAAEEKASELEKRSIEGLLKETNKAVVTGWEKLLDTVESELNKAKKSIEELNEAQKSVDELGEQADRENESSEPPKAENSFPGPQEPVQGERT